MRKPRRHRARTKHAAKADLSRGPIIGPGECCRPEIIQLVADLRASPLPPLLPLVGIPKRERLRALEREKARENEARRRQEPRGKTRWREVSDDLRPLEELLEKAEKAKKKKEEKAKKKLLQESLEEWIEEIKLEAIANPESFAARKERQIELCKMLKSFAFSEWITLQPNGVLSSDGQRLKDVIPKIIRMVNPIAFGKDAAKPWNRDKCIQGVVFFEGAVDDHVHIAIFSNYEIDPADLEDVIREVFLEFFKKGTVWVDALDDESRDDVIWYCCKEIWKRNRYESVTFFGPNWSNDDITIPLVGEAHMRRREWVWPERTVRIPELRECDPASLKLILQDAREEGRWSGPDPRYMPYDELEREARRFVREEAVWSAKVALARAIVAARRRFYLDKYYWRAGAVFIPHQHRLTPDFCGCTTGCSGSLTSRLLSTELQMPTARGPPNRNGPMTTLKPNAF